jgi:hypothetical protein
MSFYFGLFMGIFIVAFRFDMLFGVFSDKKNYKKG